MYSLPLTRKTLEEPDPDPDPDPVFVESKIAHPEGTAVHCGVCDEQWILNYSWRRYYGERKTSE